jgi:hypothetical protein
MFRAFNKKGEQVAGDFEEYEEAREAAAGGFVEFREPQFYVRHRERYTMYANEGVVKVEVADPYGGDPMLFTRVANDDTGNNGCLTIAEAERFLEVFAEKIREAKDAKAMYDAMYEEPKTT